MLCNGRLAPGALKPASIRGAQHLTRFAARAFHAESEHTPSGSLPANAIVRAQPSVDPTRPQVTELRVLSGGNLLEVQLAPSQPLYARRNALTAILSGSNNITTSGNSSESAVGVVSRSVIPGGLFKPLLARQPLIYDRVISTRSVTALVSGGDRGRASHFQTLKLDGTIDWIVLSGAKICAYAGSALSVSARGFWAFGAPPTAHTFVSGRGCFALAAPAQLFKVAVEAGESILVQKEHLAAYSADASASARQPRIRQLASSFAPPAEPLRWAVPQVKRIPVGNELVQRVWAAIAGYSIAIYHYAAGLGRLSATQFSTKFVEIHGPTTCLVSAAYKPLPQSRSKVGAGAN